MEVFFAISGFVILMSLHQSLGFGHFIVKRLLRLFPAMLIASIFIYAASLFILYRPAGLLRDAQHEADDRLFRRTGGPSGKRVVLRQRRRGDGKQAEGHPESPGATMYRRGQYPHDPFYGALAAAVAWHRRRAGIHSGPVKWSGNIGNALRSVRSARIRRIFSANMSAGLKVGGKDLGGNSSKVSVNSNTSSMMP